MQNHQQPELFIAFSAGTVINKTPCTFRSIITPKLSSASSKLISLRKIILLDVTEMQPFTVSCTLVEKTPRNPNGIFGVFYQHTSTPSETVAIINEDPLPMRIGEVQTQDTLWTELTALKGQLRCSEIIVEYWIEDCYDDIIS